jgi:SAM-dependent methyltransferase
MDTPHPFDSTATAYDDTFTHRRLGVWLRGMVRAYVPFQAKQRVLELGCGTGEDALWLAERGVHITATDASAEMLDAAREKVGAAGLGDTVTLAHFDMNRPHDTPPEISADYDGVLANFGALNCVENRPALAAFLAERVRHGGRVILVVMNPLCPWEIGWHLLHGKPRTAFRRLRGGEMAHTGGGQMIRVWYPSPGRLRREFAPAFRHVRTVGIGALLPPSYLDHLVERWPGTFARLARLDRRSGRYFPLTHLNDHYLAEFVRL